MSPAEGDSVEPPEAAGGEPAVAAEIGEKKDRLAFIGKAGDSMGKIPVMNKVPRSLRLVVFLLVIVIILAVILVAIPSKEAPPERPKTLNIDKLDDFSWSTPQPISGQLAEFSSTSFALEDELSNGTIFVERIDLHLEWQDEPDQRWAGRTRYNHPDNFALEINTSMNVSAMSDFVGNDPNSKQGTLDLSLDVGTSEYTYILLGNGTDVNLPEGVLIADVNIIVHLDEAEDLYADGPAAFKLNDTGNAFSLTISVTGKVIPED